jgi:hypothetical protein
MLLLLARFIFWFMLVYLPVIAICVRISYFKNSPNQGVNKIKVKEGGDPTSCTLEWGAYDTNARHMQGSRHGGETSVRE